MIGIEQNGGSLDTLEISTRKELKSNSQIPITSTSEMPKDNLIDIFDGLSVSTSSDSAVGTKPNKIENVRIMESFIVMLGLLTTFVVVKGPCRHLF